jgi:diguanylate cyclase (GGDEF)-like protein
MIVNLSFGIALSDAVGRHGLTDADFAPTDLAVEMLYLLEAKNSVMEELHNLNRRLHDARLRAEEQALTDTLTGLRNRRAMDGTLARLIAADEPFGLMHIDLDLFKQVNDTLGHAAGDHVLVQVARVLQSASRAGDGVFRVGGDEFVVVFPGLADAARLQIVARRMIEALAHPIPWGAGTAQISASVGIVVSTLYTEPQADRMLSDADRALYASKNAGRGQVTLHRI